ncbi:MAG: response regulator [Phycisphaerae bacterium]|nr:response regulator [Phycisphaerae bacterium]
MPRMTDHPHPRPRELPFPRPHVTVPPSTEPIRVLLVDDQAIVGEVVRRAIATVGGAAIELRVVERPEEAVSTALAFAPTVILQDLVMPQMSGCELLERYRAEPALAEVPVVMLTSAEDASTKAEAFERGASDHLVKFPDPVELVARIRHHARGRLRALARKATVPAAERDGDGDRRRNPLRFGPLREAECDLAVIGGGFSGLMTVANLLVEAPSLRASVFERRPRPGPGVAYGACDEEHLLNVPAGRMGATPDRPLGYHEWLERRSPGRHGTGDFTPRALYARYLLETVQEAVTRASQGGSPPPSFVADAVVHLEPRGAGLELLLASGRVVEARGAVLALGLPQARAPWRGAEDRASEPIPRRLLLEDPWEPEVLAGVPKDREVLLVGSGLTAIDMVLALRRLGHRARIVIASRNGRFPLPHAAAHGPPPALDGDLLAKGPREAFRAIRALVRSITTAHGHGAGRASGHGGDHDHPPEWQPAIDAVRPHAARAWRQWSPAQRRFFIRRLRPFWEIHRHRVPPNLLARLEEELRAGTIELLAASVASIAAPAAESLRIGLRIERGGDEARGAIRTIEVARAINCAGPSMSVEETVDPLLGSLLRAGLASVDPLGLGLRVDDDGRLIGRDGTISTRVRLIGALRRGDLWETTAVPELRVQAAAAAKSFAAELAGRTTAGA